MMQNKRIAVTGGIGSGKTEFCKILKEKGYPVFSCDEISDELWRDEDYLAGLAALFPSCTLCGKPQKKAVARLVFSDREAMKALNAYAHPRIMDALMRRMQAYPAAIAEVPLLFEGGYETLFDVVVILKRGEDARMRGVARRDGLTEDEVKARMRAQKEHDETEGGKYLVVENNGTLDALYEAAEEVVKKSGI